jgi:hypothetical protein
MHRIIEKKFYLGPKFGTLFNKKWITISELLQEALLDVSDTCPRDVFLDGVELRVVRDETAMVELNDEVLYVFR